MQTKEPFRIYRSPYGRLRNSQSTKRRRKKVKLRSSKISLITTVTTTRSSRLMKQICRRPPSTKSTGVILRKPQITA